jgi:hypothetical protein
VVLRLKVLASSMFHNEMKTVYLSEYCYPWFKNNSTEGLNRGSFLFKTEVECYVESEVLTVVVMKSSFF